MNAEKTRRDITVKHPKYGKTTVKAARDSVDALMEAARRWGAQWSVVMAEAEFLDEKEKPTSTP